MRDRTVVSFGRWERVRLWFSYQRYALLLSGMCALSLLAVAYFAPGAWYLWLVAALVTARVLPFAYQVYGRFPRKMRATALATRRIRDGRFHPRSVRAYCGDPCFRVVAREILVRAGLAGNERRALIRQFRAQAREPALVLRFDNQSETPVQVYGSLSTENRIAIPTTDMETS